MKISKETIDILKNFASINSNLVIKPGNKIVTMSVTKDILAEYYATEKFDKQISIYDLGQLLSAYSSFSDPELVLEDKFLTIKQGKQQVTYIYADESVLITPKKSLTMPTDGTIIKLALSGELLSRLQKMASIFSVQDLCFSCDGETISVKVFDAKNPTENVFEIELDDECDEVFNVNFKVEKLRLFPSDYTVEISSKKISKWSATSINLEVFVAVELTSTFG